jgi:hypothetical protein
MNFLRELLVPVRLIGWLAIIIYISKHINH